MLPPTHSARGSRYEIYTLYLIACDFNNLNFGFIPIRKNNPTFSYVLHVIFAILFLIDIQKYQFRNAFASLTHNPQENVGLFLRIGIISLILRDF